MPKWILAYAIFSVMVLAFAGCATTDPMAGSQISYHLPQTNAIATLDLTLTNCAPMSVQAKLTVTAVSGAQKEIHQLLGKDLSSQRLKRTLIISAPEGILTGINNKVTDQTAVIVGDVIKIAATVATFAAASNVENLVCRNSVEQAVARAVWLEKEIKQKRDVIAASDQANRDANLVKQVDTMAQELVALRTGDGPLHVQTTAKADLTKLPAGPDTITDLRLDPLPFEKWFGATPDRSDAAVKARSDALNFHFGLVWSAKIAQASSTPMAPAVTKEPSRACGFSLKVPQVQTATLTVKATGHELTSVDPNGGRLGIAVDIDMPVAQWTGPAEMCIDAGFGENRSLRMAFDKYGRTTEFEWSSDATAANVSTALAGYAPNVQSTVNALNGEAQQAAKDKAELTKLQTQQALNELRACKDILDAGGYTCPKE